MDQYIQKLHLKYNSAGKLYQEHEYKISMADIVRDSKRFSKSLIKDLKNKNYQFKHAIIKTIMAENKERVIFQFSLMDTIVGGFVAEVMNKVLEKSYSEKLYSYRKGKSYIEAVQKFAQFTREHYANYSDPKKRGLYILNRDIKSYTDEIPVGEDSPLWRILNKYFNIADDPYILSLIKRIIRCEVKQKSGNYSMLIGIPTGQPITATLYNLYAMELDNLLDHRQDCLYIRYSDDIIFGHSDPLLVNEIETQMNQILSSLRLRFKTEKAQNYYFNSAGKGNSQFPTYTGTHSIDFLGCAVSFNGTVALKSERFKQVISALKKRIITIMMHSNNNALGKNICQVLNNLLFTKSHLFQVKSVNILKYVATDRNQLKDLDYQLAKMISERISGIKGVKSFRVVSYKKIRNDWGLKSFFHYRNLYGNSKVDR